VKGIGARAYESFLVFCCTPHAVLSAIFCGALQSHRTVQKEFVMSVTQAEELRKAIENLIDVKMLDAIARPGGIDRLLAHRRTGVASFDIRNAERKLQDAIAGLLASEGTLESQVA
jgi:hypothetical protein